MHSSYILVFRDQAHEILEEQLVFLVFKNDPVKLWSNMILFTISSFKTRSFAKYKLLE